jgi:hypothetical protein
VVSNGERSQRQKSRDVAGVDHLSRVAAGLDHGARRITSISAIPVELVRRTLLKSSPSSGDGSAKSRGGYIMASRTWGLLSAGLLAGPMAANALTLAAGQSVTFNFDLTHATPAPVYDFVLVINQFADRESDDMVIRRFFESSDGAGTWVYWDDYFSPATFFGQRGIYRWCLLFYGRSDRWKLLFESVRYRHPWRPRD